jgi:hypothetical protein
MSTDNVVITTAGIPLDPEPPADPGAPRAPRHYVLNAEPGHFTLEMKPLTLTIEKAEEPEWPSP